MAEPTPPEPSAKKPFPAACTQDTIHGNGYQWPPSRYTVDLLEALVDRIDEDPSLLDGLGGQGSGVAFIRPGLFPVHRNDAGTAETKVVLDGDLGSFDLAFVRLATQLPH